MRASAGRHSAAAITASLVGHAVVLALSLVRARPPADVAEPLDLRDTMEVEIEPAAGTGAPTPPPTEAHTLPPGAPPAPPPAPVAARAPAELPGASRAAPHRDEPSSDEEASDPPEEAPAPESAAKAPAEDPQPLAAAAVAAEAPPPRGAAEAPGAAPGAPPAGPPGAASPPAPGAADEYGPPGEAPTLPGIGAAPVWSVPGAVAPEAPRPAPTGPSVPAPTPRDVAGDVLRGTLRKRDKELGIEIPSAGVVAGTLADSARTVEIAGDARATFEVSLGAKGEVQRIRVVSFSAGNDGAWQRVAKQAASSLASRGLAGSGEPATVIVKVESTKRYPAGSKQKVDVQPVCANEVVEEVARSLAELSGDQGQLPPPKPATLDPRRRFCIPVAVVGAGDASNLGAHKINVVKSSFQVVRQGDRQLPADEVKPLENRARWLQPRESREAKPTPPKKKKKKKKP